MERKNIELAEMQQIELNMLISLKDLCERNKLRYYIDGGTLLGAYCYEGFIPWDDDIDIKMPRPDYERLHEYADELPTHIKIIRPEDDGYSYTFTKLVDTRTILIENPGEPDEHVGSVYIDILPMDGHDPRTLRRLERLKTLYHISKRGFPGNAKGILYSLLYSPAGVYKKMTRMAKQCCYDSAEFVGLLVDGDMEKEKFSRKSLDNSADFLFEGEIFPATSEYEDHLVRFYGPHILLHKKKGDLPQYPSGHSYEVYWK